MKKKIRNELWRDIIINFFQTKGPANYELRKITESIKTDEKKLENESNSKKRDKLLSKIEDSKKKLARLINNPIEIIEWINDAANKNISIEKRTIKVTHALKFTHSSAPNDGILVEGRSDIPLLTTESIQNKKVDMAHRDGSLITISRFLALSNNDELIYDLILKNDFSFLESFTKNKEQYKKWKEGLSNLIGVRNIDSAQFTKQIYFPVKDENYHLLAPLMSSTLMESMYHQIQVDSYRKKTTRFNANSDLEVYSSVPKNKMTLIRVGGTNAQNVSMLNKGRIWKTDGGSKDTYGVYYTFSSQPPVWQTQLRPPIYIRSFFYELSKSTEVKETIKYLANFLNHFENLQLSIKNPKRMKWLEQWVENLTDEVIVYVKTIQTLPAGWSKTADIKLKLAHQLLLDCHRDDESFIHERNSFDWREVIVRDFAHWLNYRLRSANEQFTPQDAHTKLWMKLFETNFRDVLNIKHLVNEEG